MRRSLFAPAVMAVLAALACGRGAPVPGGDPLAREIERWSRFVRENTATDEVWKQAKEGAEPALGRAAQALREGRRNLALLRFAAVHENLAAAAYFQEWPAAKLTDTAAFEAEWKRMGPLLLREGGPAAGAEMQSAATRAMREAALSQIKVYYQASLDFGRNTMLENGLFYLGAAKAWRDFVDFTDELESREPLAQASATSPAPPPVRGLEPDIDALEGEFLAAYRPPASIDKHREFINANSMLKEARELDTAGLHYGALLRYLQAALDFAPLRPGSKLPDPASVAAQIKTMEGRLAGAGVDHSLGQLFVEIAEAGLAENPPEAGPGRATAIAGDILPRYLAALEPAQPRPPRPEPRVTVTLVRWPYT